MRKKTEIERNKDNRVKRKGEGEAFEYNESEENRERM